MIQNTLYFRIAWRTADKGHFKKISFRHGIWVVAN